MAAYTYVSAGTMDYQANVTTLAPGLPAGRSAGNLLLASSLTRVGAQTYSGTTGWTELAFRNGTNVSMVLLGRFATADADDNLPILWTGTTADCMAVIECFSGDVHTNLNTIVHQIDADGNESNQDSVFNVPSIGPTTLDDCMIFIMTMRRKTTAADPGLTAVTVTDGATKRVERLSIGLNAAFMFVTATKQLVGTGGHNGDDFTRDGTNETQLSDGWAIAIRTQSAAPPGPVIPLMGQIMM